MPEGLTTDDHARPITRWGTPVIHETTRSVTEFGDELHEPVRNMFTTMRVAEGVGLAATRVGVGVSVFIRECSDTDDHVQRRVVCNPVVELPRGKGHNLDITEEGCLSWPGSYSDIPHPDKAICRGRGAYGKEVRLPGTGLLARYFRYETDHLDDAVFGDRVSDRSRRKPDAQVADLVWRYLEDWPISPKRDSTPRPGEQ